MSPPRVVIVGGGFGGLACAQRLAGAPVDVLLIDHRDFHQFTPLLYQVATALLTAPDIAYPFRAAFRHSPNLRFMHAAVTALDLDRRTVHTRGGETVQYDYLVLATGSENNYFGNPALATNTLSMKTLPQAQRLRNHVLACLERAAQSQDDREREAWLTFVVVGGGPAGVEFTGALVELLRQVLGREYMELPPDSGRIVLVEGMETLLPPFPNVLGDYTRRVLERRGVQVLTGTLVERAAPERVLLSNGQEIATRTVVWSAGVRATELAGLDGARTRAGRLPTDEHMRISR